MANLTRDLVVRILADTTKLNAGVDQANTKMSAWGRGMKVAGAAAGAALIAAPVIEFLGDSAVAAEEDKRAQAELARQLKVSTGATDDQVAAVEESIRALSLATGVADDELRPAFAALARSTGDTETAQDQLAIAMDIAAARGVDLTTVTSAMERANNGNVTALSRMGIATKDATGETLTLEQTMANAQRTYEGAAEAAVTPSQRMQIAWQELQEQIGTALLPVLENLSKFMADTLLPAFQVAVEWVQEHWPEIQRTIKTVVDFISPILDGLFTFLKTQFDTITGIIEVFVDLLHGDFSGAWEAVKGVISGVWEGIKGIIGDAVQWIKDRLGDSTAAGLLKFISELPGKIANAAAGMWDGIKDAFRSAINWIIRGWNGLEFKMPSFEGLKVAGHTVIPGFEGPTLGLPQIPELASGGIARRPTLALVGESGPEAIVPLSRGGMGGITMNNVTIVANDPEQLVRALQEYARRNGGIRLSGGVTAVS